MPRVSEREQTLEEQVATMQQLVKVIPSLKTKVTALEDSVEELREDLENRKYYRDYGDHSSRYQKFMMTKTCEKETEEKDKSIEAGSKKLSDEMKKEREDKTSKWTMSLHGKLKETLANYGQTTENWDNSRDYSADRNWLSHDQRVISVPLLKGNKERLVSDPKLLKYVKTLHADRPVLNEILDTHIPYPAVWMNRPSTQ